MSTDLITEEKNGTTYSLTRFAGSRGVMFQITQDYENETNDGGVLFIRSVTAYVHVTEQDLRDMLSAIEKAKQDFIHESIKVLNTNKLKLRD